MLRTQEQIRGSHDVARRRYGVIEIILSAISFGFLGLFGKLAFAVGLTPGEILTLRFLMATLILWPWMWLRCRHLISIAPKDLVACAGLGIIGYAVFASCYFAALSFLSVSLTALLLYTYPVLVMLASAWWLDERLRPAQQMVVPIVLVGLVCLLWGEMHVNSPVGIILGLVSAFLYAAYILVSAKVLGRVHPLTSGLYIITFAAGALALTHVSAFVKARDFSFSTWGVVVGIGFISTVLAMVLFLSGLQKLKSVEVSLLSTLEPATAVVVSVIFLHETFSHVQTLGAILVLGALIVIARSRPGAVGQAG
jgi:drug/metabolite transporter (DMT)-like permease